MELEDQPPIKKQKRDIPVITTATQEELDVTTITKTTTVKFEVSELKVATSDHHGDRDVVPTTSQTQGIQHATVTSQVNYNGAILASTTKTSGTVNCMKTSGTVNITKASGTVNITKTSGIANSTNTSEYVNCTKISGSVNSTKTAGTVNSIQPSGIVNSTNISGTVNSIQPSGIVNSTKISGIVNSIQPSGIVNSAKISGIVNSTKTSGIVNSIKTSGTVSCTKTSGTANNTYTSSYTKPGSSVPSTLTGDKMGAVLDNVRCTSQADEYSFEEGDEYILETDMQAEESCSGEALDDADNEHASRRSTLVEYLLSGKNKGLRRVSMSDTSNHEDQCDTVSNRTVAMTERAKGFIYAADFSDYHLPTG